MNDRIYPGLDADGSGGLTDAARVLLDAQVFGFVAETETGAGWPLARLQALAEQVYRAWAPYGGLPSSLPDAQRQRHERIYRAAIERARAAGWDAELRGDE